MKKASIFTKLTLTLLIAGAVAACNQDKSADKPAAAAAAKDTQAKIVYVNQDTLLAKYDYFTDLKGRLEKKGKSAQSDVESRRQAIQREIAEYQKNAATMSADQREETEKRLQRKGQEFQTYEQNAGAEFQTAQGDEMDKLYNTITDYLKTYAKKKGYKMVLSYSRANPTVLYGDESYDVTDEVVKGLNDEYKKDKK